MIVSLGRSFAALATGALILGSGTTATAAAGVTAAAPVIDRPVFNNPVGTTQERRAIFSQLVGLIDATPAGEQIRGSVFAIDDKEIVDALLNAHRRGVSVKVILDDSTYVVASTHQEYANPAYDALKAGLGTDDTKSSWAVVCDDQFEDADGVDDAERGCLSSQRGSYNHNKFFIFSRTGPLADGVTHSKVVFQASSNLTAWDANSAFQDSVTFSDADVYEGYLKYHTMEYKARHSVNVTDSPYFSTLTGTKYRAYFTPRPDPNPTNPATDPLVNALNEVSCTYVGTDGRKHQTDVRIAHTFFYNTRPQVADKLVDLRRKGCWVDVLARHIDGDIEAKLSGAGIQYRECQSANNPAPYPHDKYLLIDGDYGGDITPRVYMGSANLIGDSVRLSDETFVRITSADYHKAYLQHFYMLQKRCGAPRTS
ncbi:phospholipase D-like domain-containing protein [Microtetraspora malaysiensis]|uniref:phospholipase D-like domain-containing protein n=1 Tax=Microtetraspora malaysiensis TaxID=161358 RepID=UPI003D8FC5EB